MDRTGKVTGAHRKLLKARDEQRILGLVPVAGNFRTLVIDPAWDYDWLSLAGRAAGGYAKMTLEELGQLDVRAWADESSGCHLYCCVTNNFSYEGHKLVERWGFQHRQVISWIKSPPFGLGSYFRNSTELILFATLGETTTRPAASSIPTHFEPPRGEHSEKAREVLRDRARGVLSALRRSVPKEGPARFCEFVSRGKARGGGGGMSTMTTPFTIKESEITWRRLRVVTAQSSDPNLLRPYHVFLSIAPAPRSRSRQYLLPQLRPTSSTRNSCASSPPEKGLHREHRSQHLTLGAAQQALRIAVEGHHRPQCQRVTRNPRARRHTARDPARSAP
jgi:N6-adenosine-specific RNA methylase IME4